MPSFRRKKGVVFLPLAAICFAAAFVFFPSKAFFEEKVKEALRGQGFSNVQVTLAETGFGGVTLRDLAWAEKEDVAARPILSELAARFSLIGLMRGRVDALDIKGLNLEAQEEEDGWRVAGKRIGEAEEPSAGLDFGAFPVSALRINQSHFDVRAKAGRLQGPFVLDWRRENLVLEFGSVIWEGAGLKLQTGAIKASLTMDFAAQRGAGLWSAQDVRLIGAEETLPSLIGKGEILAEKDKIVLPGNFTDASGQTRASFVFSFPLAKAEKKKLLLKDVAFPWSGGVIQAKNILWVLGGDQETVAEVEVKKVSLDALLTQATGQKAVASGEVSGLLPLAIRPDGKILIRKGRISAGEKGVIHLPPELLSGENAQLSLARDVLKNLHYTRLEIEIDSAEDGRLVLALKAEGQNPDLSLGRPVNLNVRLTGDVLDFARQNVLLLTDPRNYLRQGGHEKP